jgi:hypothetical protein
LEYSLARIVLFGGFVVTAKSADRNGGSEIVGRAHVLAVCAGNLTRLTLYC